MRGTKSIQKILTTRLQNVLDEQVLETQSGFRKGRKELQDHVFILKEIIHLTLIKEKTTGMAFIDLEK